MVRHGCIFLAQASQIQRKRLIGPQPPFTASSNYQSSFQKPTRGYAQRVTKKEGLISSVPIASETVYR